MNEISVSKGTWILLIHCQNAPLKGRKRHTPISGLEEWPVLLHGVAIQAWWQALFHIFINSLPLSGTGSQTVHCYTAGTFFLQ